MTGLLARLPPTLLVVVAVAVLQVGAGLARTQYDVVGPLGAATLRLVFAAVILLALLRPRVSEWSGRAWLAAILLGVALGGMNTLIYAAFATVPLGVAVTVEFLGPLALALVQTRRWTDALWAVLALTGVVLLGVAGASGGLAVGGLALAAGAGACWAGYILASSHLGRVLPGVDGLAVSIAVAAVLSLPLGGAGAAQAFGSPVTVMVMLLVAILSSVLPYALELEALRRLSTRVFGVLSALGPTGAAVAGLLVLGQGLGPAEIAALLLVTVASVGVTAGSRRRGSGSDAGSVPVG